MHELMVMKETGPSRRPQEMQRPLATKENNVEVGQPAQEPLDVPSEPLDAPSAKKAYRASDTPVDFMGLSNRTCRWPLFEGHEPFYEKFYCGACPIPGSPYCAAHAGQAFTRRSSTAELVRSPEAPIAPRIKVLAAKTDSTIDGLMRPTMYLPSATSIVVLPTPDAERVK